MNIFVSHQAVPPTFCSKIAPMELPWIPHFPYQQLAYFSKPCDGEVSPSSRNNVFHMLLSTWVPNMLHAGRRLLH